MIRLILILLALALPQAGRAAPATHITAALASESDRPAPGQEVALAFRMAPAAGWHGYWVNPGDAGLGMRLRWMLPPGVSAGPLRYPVPQTLVVAGQMNHVYEGPYALLTSLRLAPGLAPGTRLPVRVEAEWLACTLQICVPERATLATELVVGDGAVAPAQRAEFDAWRAALPSPIAGTGTYSVTGGALRLAIPLPASVRVSDPHVFPYGEQFLRYAAEQRFSRTADRLIVETRADAQPSGEKRVLVAIAPGTGLDVTLRPGPVPTGEPLSGSVWRTTLIALAGALAGGLLLNIMPCVFPILSLKAMSLARSGGAPGAARAEAWGYTAGAVGVALALAGLLLALRAGGAEVGWAFQLQDPRVVALLLVLAAALTLNLAGAYELPMLAGGAGERHGWWGGVATGALAAFAATPCSGPFMAAATGAALLLPWPAALAVFAGLGLGLALPFLLIGLVPRARRILPRPGPWLARFRRVMAIPMGLTALALAWLLWRQAGTAVLAGALVVLILVGALLVWLGRRQRGGKAAWLPALAALGVAITAPALASGAGPGASSVVPLGAERFSAARLSELRAEGRPVFLYFTADWCLSCKVNEAAAIDRASVRDSFRRAGIVTMVGDWTRRDAEITRFLTAHGRSGVPLYLFYPKGGGDPQELPQLLTPGMLEGLGRG